MFSNFPLPGEAPLCVGSSQSTEKSAGRTGDRGGMEGDVGSVLAGKGGDRWLHFGARRGCLVAAQRDHETGLT